MAGFAPVPPLFFLSFMELSLDQLKDFINWLSRKKLGKVVVETPEFKVSVENHAPSPAQVSRDLPPVYPGEPAQAPAETSPPSPSAQLKEITSPLVGTLFLSSKPGSAAFVSVGTKVKEGDTIALIEAMKLFTEVPSPLSGRIARILVENEVPVEYGQPLFLVDPE